MITAHIIAKKRIIMLFEEIITVNSLERQPVIKEGPVLIRNINKLLKSGKSKKPPEKSNNEELKPQDVLYESFEQNTEMFRFIYQKCKIKDYLYIIP
jgi:hypothetical protein